MVIRIHFSLRFIAILFLAWGSVSAQGVNGVPSESVAATLGRVEETLLVLKSQKGPKDVNLFRSIARQLRDILAADPNSGFRSQVEANLDLVNESLAYHELMIASFYMVRSNGHSLRGAELRLQAITQQYPKFSKMDEVLLRLGEIARLEEREDDAPVFYWRLICNYPSSEYIGSAFERLNQIGVKSWEGCQKFRP